MTLTTRRSSSHRDPAPLRGTDLPSPEGEKGGPAVGAGPATHRQPATPAASSTPQPPAKAPVLLLAGEDHDDADPHIVRGID